MKKLLFALLLVAGAAHAGRVKTSTDDFDGTRHVWIERTAFAALFVAALLAVWGAMARNRRGAR